MKNKSALVKWFPFILIGVFAVITAFTVYMNGDDYLWYYSVEDSALDVWRTPNGRLFSNQMTIWLVRSYWFRTLFIAATLAAFLILLGKLTDFEKKLGSARYYIALFLLVTIPAMTYAETVRWISAYTNYVISIMLVLIYLLFLFRCICTDHRPKLWTAVLFLPLSLLSGLCVEHVTIFNVILSAAAVILLLKLKKKGVLHSAAFLAGAIVSCIIMFGNHSYSDIYESGDAVGNRNFELGLSNIMQNAYSFVVMHYTKDSWMLSIVIAVGFTVMYFRADNGDKKPKYLDLCMVICWLYTAYSVFAVCFSDLRPNSPAMRVVALETAFTFVYVVATAYLINVFLSKNGKIRAYIYLAGTFLLTAPFLVISPVTARCFFANYVFRILLCGEIIVPAFQGIASEKADKFRKAAFFICFAAVFVISYECAANKYYDAARFDYIREQLQDERSRSLHIMLLPYTEYSHDDLDEGIGEEGHGVGDVLYGDYILKYHGIDSDKARERLITYISPYDYYLEKSE